MVIQNTQDRNIENILIETMVEELTERYQILEDTGRLNNSLIEIVTEIYNKVLQDNRATSTIISITEEIYKKVESYFHDFVNSFVEVEDMSLFVEIWEQLKEYEEFEERLNKFASLLDILNLKVDANFYLKLWITIPEWIQRINKSVLQNMKSTAGNSPSLESILNIYDTYSLNGEALKVVEEEFEEEESLNAIRLYKQDVSENPSLTKKEIDYLIILAKQGNLEARNKIAIAYQKYIMKMAEFYMVKYPSDLTFLDLVQEGNLGIIKAIEKYDSTKKTSFRHYAFYVMNTYMSRAIPNLGRIIKIPTYVEGNREKIMNLQPNEEKEIEEIAKELGLSITQVEGALSISPVESLDSYIENSENFDWDDLRTRFITGNGEDNVDTMYTVETMATMEELYELLKSVLKEREYDILKSIYIEEKTLEELSDIYRISKARVSQIDIEAIKKIRFKKWIAPYVEYADNPIDALTNIYLSRTTFNFNSSNRTLEYTEEQYQEAQERAKRTWEILEGHNYNKRQVNGSSVLTEASSKKRNIKRMV